MRFGPLSSYPFAVFALSDVPFGPKKNPERYIIKDFSRKGTSIRHVYLRYKILIKRCIAKDVRGYFSKGTSLRTPLGIFFKGYITKDLIVVPFWLFFSLRKTLGDIFQRVHH